MTREHTEDAGNIWVWHCSTLPPLLLLLPAVRASLPCCGNSVSTEMRGQRSKCYYCRQSKTRVRPALPFLPATTARRTLSGRPSCRPSTCTSTPSPLEGETDSSSLATPPSISPCRARLSNTPPTAFAAVEACFLMSVHQLCITMMPTISCR